MTLEEAAELVLSGLGRVLCSHCSGNGGHVTDMGQIEMCGTCWAQGDLVEDALIEAHELLGLPPPEGRSFSDAYAPYYEP